MRPNVYAVLCNHSTDPHGPSIGAGDLSQPELRVHTARGIKRTAARITGGLIVSDYKTLAARQAAKSYGERYARYIEKHTLSLIERGKLPASAVDQTLGERLSGNNGE